MLSNILFKIITKLMKKYKKFEKREQNNIHYDNILKAGGRIGKGCKFGSNVILSGLNNIRIGNNVHIGTGSFIRAEGGLEIKDNTIISRNAVLYTTSHNYEGTLLPFDNTFTKRKVIIEENVWIGMNVTIAPGTIIGEGSIIALGSRIFGKIPKLSIIGDNGWKIIKQRNEKHYEQLKKNKNFACEDGYSLNN
jgi:acetyltransferase-like isoleucine patch superfamily enzyme